MWRNYMLKAKLEDIMTEGVVTIKSGSTVRDVAHILLRQRISGLFICKPNNHKKIIGVITITDLLGLLKMALSFKRHKINKLENIGQLLVDDVMHKDIVAVQKNTKLERIVALMSKKDVHTIPVFDGKKLVGVVGKHDILNVVFSK